MKKVLNHQGEMNHNSHKRQSSLYGLREPTVNGRKCLFLWFISYSWWFVLPFKPLKRQIFSSFNRRALLKWKLDYTTYLLYWEPHSNLIELVSRAKREHSKALGQIPVPPSGHPVRWYFHTHLLQNILLRGLYPRFCFWYRRRICDCTLFLPLPNAPSSSLWNNDCNLLCTPCFFHSVWNSRPCALGLCIVEHTFRNPWDLHWCVCDRESYQENRKNFNHSDPRCLFNSPLYYLNPRCPNHAIWLDRSLLIQIVLLNNFISIINLSDLASDDHYREEE